MKKLFVLLFVVALSSSAYSQIGRSVTRAFKIADRVLTVKQLYDWLTEEDYVASYYVNPNGTWKSSSGAVFYLYANQYGFNYQNASDGAWYKVSSSGNLNFYYADFYQGNIFLYRNYYTLIDQNSMVVSNTNGGEFYWTRIR